MNITQKIGLLFLSSTFIYLKILNLSFLIYFGIEIVTLGVVAFLIILYEALNIDNCENEYKEYKKRQMAYKR